MFTASDFVYHPSIPIIDPESAAELVRRRMLLDLLDPLLARLLPEGEEDISSLRYVLDLGCGQGDWALDLAYEREELEVAGVDPSPALIALANRKARDQMLTNASFGVVDLTCPPFDFSDASFDLVTASFLRSRLQEHEFETVLQECRRVLTPGGTLRMIECTHGRCNSPSIERLSVLYEDALTKAELQPVKRNYVEERLRGVLKEAGFSVNASKRDMLDFSHGQPDYPMMKTLITTFFDLVRPFVLRMKAVSEPEYARLLIAASEEVSSTRFRGHWHLLTIWAGKDKDGKVAQVWS